MKKLFEEPKLEVQELTVEDVITTSDSTIATDGNELPFDPVT